MSLDQSIGCNLQEGSGDAQVNLRKQGRIQKASFTRRKGRAARGRDEWQTCRRSQGLCRRCCACKKDKKKVESAGLRKARRDMNAKCRILAVHEIMMCPL
eukprot:1147317-Pelagomonas_calceolata.AAC.4